MNLDKAHLLLDFIQCRYKAALARRRELTQIREFHLLAKRQQYAYVQQALSSLIAKCDSARILRAPASLSRSIRKHHRLVLDATCVLAGHEIMLSPIEASDSKDDDVRSLTPIFFCDSNKVGEGDKLVACVFSLLIVDQIPYSTHRAKIIYGDGFDTRYVALRGKNGATRIATEARHVLDAFLKFLGDDASPPLQLNRHCELCEFRQRCRDEALKSDDISLLSGLSNPEVTQWKDKGILTSTQLAHTFQPKRYCRPNYAPKQHSQRLQARRDAVHRRVA